ncbi:uncharacterized protein [Anas acuta]|uniref:uncharacterized protein isoform X1 n=2 Tax=Anas acuta TaxID=28680 RepID=UPI0035C89DEE
MSQDNTPTSPCLLPALGVIGLSGRSRAAQKAASAAPGTQEAVGFFFPSAQLGQHQQPDPMEKHRDLEEILLSVPQSRSVGIEITNKTSVTLRNPSYFCQSGEVFTPPSPSISPQSREMCVFVKRHLSAWGVSGALLYVSEPFSFAVMFYNPRNNTIFDHQYAVEIFQGPTISGSLESLYWSMRGDRPQSQTYRKEVLDKKNSSIVVSDGTYSISATMSNHNKAVLKVLVEETRGPPPKYTPNCFPHPKDISKDRQPQAFTYLPK